MNILVCVCEHRKEHSGWSSENLTTVAGKGRDVRCQSTHLTSFAMLVDYGGVVHVSATTSTHTSTHTPNTHTHAHTHTPNTYTHTHTH